MATDVMTHSEKLDDILKMPQPERTHQIVEWLQHFDTKHSGLVLLRTNDGKPMKFPYRGETFNIPPKGRRLDRKTAFDLLLKYGEKGIYHGKDQETGMTESRLRTMPKVERERFEGIEFNFIRQYLTHIPDSQTSQAEEDAQFAEAVAEVIAEVAV